jgi:hypothetical protein
VKLKIPGAYHSVKAHDRTCRLNPEETRGFTVRALGYESGDLVMHLQLAKLIENGENVPVKITLRVGPQNQAGGDSVGAQDGWPVVGEPHLRDAEQRCPRDHLKRLSEPLVCWLFRCLHKPDLWSESRPCEQFGELQLQVHSGLERRHVVIHKRSDALSAVEKTFLFEGSHGPPESGATHLQPVAKFRLGR